jgi:ferredoxin
MKVSIDREECTSCTVCWDDCPGFFEENPDDEWSQVVSAHRIDDDPAKGVVPQDLEDCVREAADSCPVDIIHIEE